MSWAFIGTGFGVASTDCGISLVNSLIVYLLNLEGTNHQARFCVYDDRWHILTLSSWAQNLIRNSDINKISQISLLDSNRGPWTYFRLYPKIDLSLKSDPRLHYDLISKPAVPFQLFFKLCLNHNQCSNLKFPIVRELITKLRILTWWSIPSVDYS